MLLVLNPPRFSLCDLIKYTRFQLLPKYIWFQNVCYLSDMGYLKFSWPGRNLSFLLLPNFTSLYFSHFDNWWYSLPSYPGKHPGQLCFFSSPPLPSLLLSPPDLSLVTTPKSTPLLLPSLRPSYLSPVNDLCMFMINFLQHARLSWWDDHPKIEILSCDLAALIPSGGPDLWPNRIFLQSIRFETISHSLACTLCFLCEELTGTSSYSFMVFHLWLWMWYSKV